MTDGPLVTVFTPLYNHEPYLDDYVGGLLAQTYSNVELIVYDDGSTDGSWEKLCSYEQALRAKFPVVTLERHDNVGPTEEFIEAVSRAQGELLCILESDDYYLPRKLEANVRLLLANPEVGAVHSETDWIHGQKLEHRHWRATGRTIPSGWIFEQLLVGNFVMVCSFCCRFDLFRQHVDLSRYIERGYQALDYAQFLDLARHTKFAYIDEPLARYRVLPNSWSHATDRERSFAWQLSTYAMKLDYVREHDVSSKTSAHVQRQYYDLLYLGGLRACKKEATLEGYAWLRRQYPDEHQGLVHLLLRFIVRSRFLCALFRRLFEAPPVAALWAHLRVRRRWQRDVLDRPTDELTPSSKS